MEINLNIICNWKRNLERNVLSVFCSNNKNIYANNKNI